MRLFAQVIAAMPVRRASSSVSIRSDCICDSELDRINSDTLRVCPITQAIAAKSSSEILVNPAVRALGGAFGESRLGRFDSSSGRYSMPYEQFPEI